MADGETGRTFRLAYVPGVTPAKWVNVWTERMPDVPITLVAVPAAEVVDLLRNGGADAGLVRLPIDRDGLSVIPLYVETTVAVVPKDHVATAADEVSIADLADDEVFHPLDDTIEWPVRPGLPAFTRPATTADAVEMVASGTGILLVPLSLARLHHRRDLTHRPVSDAPQSQVALSWPTDATTDLVEDFIGVVRGRTVNSSRGRTPAAPAEKPAQRRTPKPAQKSSGRRAVPADRRKKGRRPR
ncbi:LysR family substrate-binding domain-containing protein [Streptosporangium saharense]|uniref:DNA-binding transcriptional LysR family regulator n=1 Tax=Streptosporangium saharense TaxID=1706840 RepID=A0A7W7QQX1_9ACTN|nr:LysR family substrate-binding domain-containing protein [Streptosporangium saharense]MBB4917471.1 DNA-binding transcriptional LysR family regulator [Streptosporangium saharense]